jgi:hypothetical protein
LKKDGQPSEFLLVKQAASLLGAGDDRLSAEGRAPPGRVGNLAWHRFHEGAQDSRLSSKERQFRGIEGIQAVKGIKDDESSKIKDPIKVSD